MHQLLKLLNTRSQFFLFNNGGIKPPEEQAFVITKRNNYVVTKRNTYVSAKKYV
jgi:hypothetical protein